MNFLVRRATTSDIPRLREIIEASVRALSGVAFYKAKGYVEIENHSVPLGNGKLLPIARMTKTLS